MPADRTPEPADAGRPRTDRVAYGVAEPLTHYVQPPPDTAAPRSEQAIETAMATTMFHWTPHPWSICALGQVYGSSPALTRAANAFTASSARR